MHASFSLVGLSDLDGSHLRIQSPCKIDMILFGERKVSYLEHLSPSACGP